MNEYNPKEEIAQLLVDNNISLTKIDEFENLESVGLLPLVHKEISDYLKRREKKGDNSLFKILQIQDPETKAEYPLQIGFQTLQKEEQSEDPNKEVISNFIWDDKKIIENKVFPMDIIHNNFCMGFLIPREEEVVVKGKNYGTKQVNRPIIINSNKTILEINETTKQRLKINFENTPSFLPRRWKLKFMKAFLDGKTDPVNGKALFEMIAKQYNKYIYRRKKSWLRISAIWDIGTYLYMIFEAYPIYELRGLSGTAKTKENAISSFIAFNGGRIMVNPSESTLFRETDEVRGTKYFDEAEKLFVFNKSTKQYEGDVRVELINASYTKDGVVPRQEKIGNKFFTKWYAPFSPTRVTSINGLFGATETRSITQITTKSPNEDDRGELDPNEDKNEPIWSEIRDNCYRFALENWKPIKEIYNNFPKDCGLKRRDLQIWKPILSIAKFIDQNTYNEILAFAIELSEMRLDDFIPESSFDFMCLSALKQVVEIYNHTDKHYLERISEIFMRDKGDDEKKNPYLNRNIGQHLKKLGFDKARDGTGTYIISDADLFNQIVNPICPQLAILSTPSTPSTQSLSNNNNSGVDTVKINVDKKKEFV